MNITAFIFGLLSYLQILLGFVYIEPTFILIAPIFSLVGLVFGAFALRNKKGGFICSATSLIVALGIFFIAWAMS